MAKSKRTAAYFLRIAGVLTLICSVIALMLAFVNSVTKDKIAENTEKEKVEAISRIFGEVDKIEQTEVAGYEVNLVKNKNGILGYTVSVYPQGYGGEINMLVGIIVPGGSVAGVEIISMSETPGVGSRVKSDPDFLPQFKGMTGTLVIGENVDAISGASISSKAVTAGINEALSVKIEIDEKYYGSAGTETEAAPDTESETEPGTAPDTENVALVTEKDGEETHIDPALIGAGEQAYEWNPQDKINVVSRDTTYYLEHETTDTAAPDAAGA